MQLYWTWLSLLPEISLRQKLSWLKQFSDPEEIYSSARLPDGSEPNRDLTQAEQIVNICRRKGIGILPIRDERYPGRLRSIIDPPLVLYYRGILPDFEGAPFIGVVGTRKSSGYGERMAQRISGQIAACGGVVVSGGAAGIDTKALVGAYRTGKPTVTVLGCGVDVAYPPKNRKLFSDLTEDGCILSEYPPGTGPKPWQFPQRNRIISGICNGILVVEAPVKSGALITANLAAEQGRDVFVVPGNVDEALCEGSNRLLQDGAGAVFTGWDAVQPYAAQYPWVSQADSPEEPREEASPKLKKTKADKKDIDIPDAKPYIVKVNSSINLTEQEARILDCVPYRATALDQVIESTGEPAAEVLRVLTRLSLGGMIINHPGKLISRKQ